MWKAQPLTIVRVAVALLLAIHGWYRLLTGGYVPFGGYLEESGWPLGRFIAMAITGFEVLAPFFLAAGRFVLPVCAGHAFILIMGIVLVHGREGWFVVGGGRNGVEYSVLLLACLGAIAYNELAQRRR
jgi:putative oxidoreductase